MRRTFSLALLVLGACTARPPVQSPLSCKGNLADTTTWSVVDRGTFSFRLPPGYRVRPVQPIDSHVEAWTAGELRSVSFDHGPYSSSLDEVTHYTGYAECHEIIGGHPAKLVVLFDNTGRLGPAGGKKYWAAATWRDYRPGVHLTMVATTPEYGELDKIVTILRSTRLSAERDIGSESRSGVTPRPDPSVIRQPAKE